MKQVEQDEQGTGGTPDHTAAEFQGMRMLTHVPPKPGDEKASEDRFTLFWRVFGGTILSIAALAAVTVYNSVSSNISELRAELHRVNGDLTAQVARANEARAELTRKDEFNTRLTSVWDSLKTAQLQATAQATAATAQRGETDAMKERLAKAVADLDAFRKESALTAEAAKKDVAAVTDSVKKDLAGLEAMRDRLAAQGADLKAARDDVARLRTEVDRNQAQDTDRKEARDRQAKQFDETVKELFKGLQDCREKIARLEGQTTPMPRPAGPVVPAGGKSQ